ncbi:hypothetical protein QC764_311430 [Podospora pseudoanserina]|uniref:Uncharacterized protein n=1 Tax=Podospora pseudoanserina TaxID=2609844 RepID=A0ABR0IF65_9PEZI|nr:hypothetical protein QC764_311430 [Podospora pseudoanserina]
MCRKVVFAGMCSHCNGGPFEWTLLSRELPCLDAKNSGLFGGCPTGVERDEKQHEQECAACEALLGADEGYGPGMEDEETLGFVGYYTGDFGAIPPPTTTSNPTGNGDGHPSHITHHHHHHVKKGSGEYHDWNVVAVGAAAAAADHDYHHKKAYSADKSVAGGQASGMRRSSERRGSGGDESRRKKKQRKT